MKNHRTYYQILYVHADAPQQIIKSSYRTLMQQLNAHPDRGGDADEAALINRAYAVLSDAAKRKEYDREISEKARPSGGQARPGSKQARPEAAARAKPRVATPRRTVGHVCPFCACAHSYKSVIPADAVCGTCESPLSLAGQELADEAGQRKIQRIGKRSKLSYYAKWPQGQPHSGITVDISPRGMMFETAKEIPVDSILKIECSRFKAIAHVVNCRSAGNILRPNWRVGVQFVTLQFKSSRGTFISHKA